MQWADVLQRLRTLPDTFRRPGSVFGWVEAAETAELSRFTAADDNQSAQASFLQSSGRWMDVWGRALGIIRYPNEADAVYIARIKITVIAAKQTPVAIELFLLLTLGVTAQVVENTSGVAGYSVFLPGGINRAQAIAAINYVRPAGVPFSVQLSEGGPYISTINFFGRGRTTGSYLTSAATEAAPVAASTNSAQALLPTVFLTDPTLNP